MKKYFYGWYFRFQGENGTVAVIPAVHFSPERKCCSIQVITQCGSLYREFPISSFRVNGKRESMQIGNNIFSRKGMHVNFETEVENSKTISSRTGHKISEKRTVTVMGSVRFGMFEELEYDIMGPFAYIRAMECRHAVYSMRHTVNGQLTVGSKNIIFRDATGYMEGDSGVSFPKQYVWTQHFFPMGSLMFAAATVSVARMHFMGTLAVISYKNRQYRFASYLGASVIRNGRGEFILRQGRYRFHVRLLQSGGSELKAPDNGKMTRKVRENLTCGAEYTLLCGNRVLLHIKTDKAAAELDM